MDFNALATDCAPWVAPQTMAAIVRTESSFQPLTININGGARLARQPTSKDEAVVTARWLITNHYNIDIGLGQVNSTNLKKTGLRVEDAFDPCKNLAASATILNWNFQSANKKGLHDQAALHAALSAYNTGSLTRGFINGYVQKVVYNAGVQSPALTVRPIALIPSTIKPALQKKPAKRNVKKIVSQNNSKSSNKVVASQTLPDSDLMVYSANTQNNQNVFISSNAATRLTNQSLILSKDLNNSLHPASEVNVTNETTPVSKPLRLVASMPEDLCSQSPSQCSDDGWVGQ